MLWVLKTIICSCNFITSTKQVWKVATSQLTCTYFILLWRPWCLAVLEGKRRWETRWPAVHTKRIGMIWVPPDTFLRATVGIVVVCWLLNVPTTCECISWPDLLRQFYVLPHWHDSTPEKSRRKRDSNPGPSALKADALTTRPMRRSLTLGKFGRDRTEHTWSSQSTVMPSWSKSKVGWIPSLNGVLCTL